MNERTRHLKPMTNTVIVAFLIVSLFFGVYAFIYQRVQASLRSTAVQQVQSHVQQGSAETNATAKGILSQLTELRTNASVVSLQTAAELSSVHYAQLITLSDNLKSILPSTRAADSGISRLFLLFDHEEPFVCATDGIYHDLSLAHQSRSFGVEGMPVDDFLALIRASVSTDYSRQLTSVYPMMDTGSVSESCFYVLRIGRSSVSAVYAVLQIDTNALFEVLLSSSHLGQPAALYSKNNLLFSATAIPEELRQVSYERSQKGAFLQADLDMLGAQAYVYVSDESILLQIREFTYLLYFLLSASILLLVALSLLACTRLVSPTIRMNRQLQQHGHDSFNAFEDEYNQLHENLSLIRPALYTSLMDKLFHRSYLTPAERAALHTIPGFPMKSPCRVVVLGVISPEQCTPQHFADIEFLLQQLLNKPFIYSLGEGKFAMLYPAALSETDRSLQEDFEQILCSLHEKMPDKLFAVGISQTIHEEELIHSAFQEASVAFKEQWAWNQSGICFHQKTAEQICYNVSLEELEQLQRLLYAGASKEADQFFEGLVEREFGSTLNRHRDSVVCKQFFADIRGILLRLSSQYDLSPVRLSFLNWHETQQFAHILSLLRHALHYTSSLISGKQEDTENELAQSILLYLNEHYANSELSLSSLAELFDMSESTMSRFFKAHMNTTFSSYLENIRLSEAETLLTSSTLPVKDIAFVVGYTTTTTFYKAFRRKWSVSPTTYRDNAQNV